MKTNVYSSKNWPKYFFSNRKLKYREFLFTNLLNYIHQPKDHLAYEEWKNSIPNLVELLDEYPSLKPNASLLVTQLPKLQPRFYSISSSPKATADDIHVTAGIVVYKLKGKTKVLSKKQKLKFFHDRIEK
jgi:sulfite reductase alpha subunit-like flavoprotein